MLRAGGSAVVTGAIRISKAAIDAPTVRISLLDKAKQPLTTYQLNVQNGRVPPGGKRYFAWELPEPPAGAHELEIGFDLGAGHAAPATETHALPAHGPTPVEAKPLAPDSPDALPHHE